LDQHWLSFGFEQRAGEGKVHYLVVAYILIQDVQEDGIAGMSGGIGDLVPILGMGLGHPRPGNMIHLFGAGESVLLSVFAKIIFDVQTGRADDINVYGESSGTPQVEHQCRAAFENERAAGKLQRFQQGEGSDGFLKESDILDVGILGA
jgi:hypothetical protein